MDRLPVGIDGTYLQGKGAATLPAYEKTMPPLTTQGDLIVQGATLPQRFPGGGAGFYLQSQAAGEIPIYKQTMPPLTTPGDLIVQGAAVPERIALGLHGNVLMAWPGGSLPAWKDLFNLLTTEGDLWVRGATEAQRIAAGLLDTYFKGQGDGELPIYEKMTLRDTGVKIGVGTQNAGGDQPIAGVGFKPSVVIFFAVDGNAANMNHSWGFDDGTAHMCSCVRNDAVDNALETSTCMWIQRGGGDILRAYISALGSDGFTLTWTLSGTSVANFVYLCLP